MRAVHKPADVRDRTASDIMQRRVVTIGDTATVGELADLLATKRILGVPVVDSTGELVGVASVTDLTGDKPDVTDIGSAYYQDYYPQIDVWDAPPAEMRALLVRDVMSSPAITARPEDSLGKLARRMRRQRIHRLIVAERGQILGVVTTMDILKALE